MNVMAGESSDRCSPTSKFGDSARKFLEEMKPFTDFLPIVGKISALIGGVLLVGYAAKEHFFYDLSSIAAISLLLLTFFIFSFIITALVAYGFISTLWLAMVVFYVISWIRRLLRRPTTVRRRPSITWGLVAYSLLLFVWLALLLTVSVATAKSPVAWHIAEYSFLTGFLMSCSVVSISSLPGENDERKLLFACLALPILMLFLPFGPQSGPGSLLNVPGSLLNSTMTILSFRSAPDQLVSLNERAYRKVRAIAAYAGVNLVSCQVAQEFWVLREATLVWHGIGATAYLRIAGKPDASLLIPLPSDEVEVLSSTGTQLPQGCAAAGSDMPDGL
jgi:hypothetical protein